MSSAYLLVSHGSRDPRPQQAIDGLIQLVVEQLMSCHSQPISSSSISSSSTSPVIASEQRAPYGVVVKESEVQALPPIGSAVLELAPLPLHQQIQQFAEAVIQQGYRRLEILPLFLLPGVHVMEDIPAEVAIAQTALNSTNLNSSITLDVRPYVGSHPRLKDLLLQSLQSVEAIGVSSQTSQTSKILLAHGSRREEGNQPVEALAAHLGARPAYWAVPPSLETQIATLVKQGSRQITVLPYFLFEGGITDAIAQEVERIAQQFSYVRIHLGNPIGTTPALAKLVMELMV